MPDDTVSKIYSVSDTQLPSLLTS